MGKDIKKRLYKIISELIDPCDLEETLSQEESSDKKKPAQDMGVDKTKDFHCSESGKDYKLGLRRGVCLYMYDDGIKFGLDDIHFITGLKKRFPESVLVIDGINEGSILFRLMFKGNSYCFLKSKHRDNGVFVRVGDVKISNPRSQDGRFMNYAAVANHFDIPLGAKFDKNSL